MEKYIHELDLLKEYMKYYINDLDVCYGGFEYASTTYRENKDGSVSCLGSNDYLTMGSQNIISFQDWKINKTQVIN